MRRWTFVALASPVRVLFICVGNLCRPPLAEVLLRRRAADAGAAVLVFSAGTWAELRPGMYPGPAACAERHGPDGSAHVSRMLTTDIVAAQDIVGALDEGAAEASRTLRLDSTRNQRSSFGVRSTPSGASRPDRPFAQ